MIASCGTFARRARLSVKSAAPPMVKAKAYQYAALLCTGWPASNATVMPRAASCANARSTKDDAPSKNVKAEVYVHRREYEAGEKRDGEKLEHSRALLSVQVMRSAGFQPRGSTDAGKLARPPQQFDRT